MKIIFPGKTLSYTLLYLLVTFGYSMAGVFAAESVKLAQAEPTSAAAMNDFKASIQLFNSQDYAGALSMLENAIRLDPFYAAAYHNRGAVRQELSQHLSAIKDFDKAIELEADKSVLYHYFNNRAWSKYSIGRYVDALSDISMSIELNDGYSNAYHTRAMIRYMLGQISGACQDMKQSLDLGGSETAEWFQLDGEGRCPVSQ